MSLILEPGAPDDVVYELYPPDTYALTSDAFRACLVSWATVNGLPVHHMLKRQINVNASRKTIEYWVIGDAPQTPDARILDAPQTPDARILQASGMPGGSRLERMPLLAEPAGRLAGQYVCGHMTRRDETILSCTVEISHRGDHAGDHVDELHDAQWPNQQPGPLNYRGGRVDVAGRTVAEKHILTLAALDERTNLADAGRYATGDREGHAGRRRILERHAPRPVHVRPAQLGTLCERHCSFWPCPDYRDAAAGLVTGLETR